jgi:putative tryptophan/tyrosine transport system substrate-binding protein
VRFATADHRPTGWTRKASGRHNRRAFLWGISRLAVAVAGLAAIDACGLSPASPKASRVTRVGVLAFDDGTGPRWDAFRRRLGELGWIEGQNLTLEWRVADAHDEKLASLASELVNLPCDILVAAGTPAALAAKQATPTLPIVMPAVNDPVTSGLVASFAAPGGNATGSALLSPEVAPKWLELLTDVLSRLKRVAILVNAGNPSHWTLVEQAQAAAVRQGLQVRSFEVRTTEELESVMSAAAAWPAEGLVVLPDALFYTQRASLADLTSSNRLPAIYPAREYADAGGLMSYGADLVDLYHRAAGQVDKILRGTKPADLSVEQPAGFELVVNARTLQSLKLTIPPSVAPLVTEWIQ